MLNKFILFHSRSITLVLHSTRGNMSYIRICVCKNICAKKIRNKPNRTEPNQSKNSLFSKIKVLIDVYHQFNLWAVRKTTFKNTFAEPSSAKMYGKMANSAWKSYNVYDRGTLLCSLSDQIILMKWFSSQQSSGGQMKCYGNNATVEIRLFDGNSRNRKWPRKDLMVVAHKQY